MIGFVDEWNGFLDVIPTESQDLYFREEYVKLYASNDDTPLCFIYQNGGDILMMPFLRRTFVYKGNEYYDFETAYGYGGMISNTKDERFIVEALQSMQSLASENHYICGFVRFHPLLNNYKHFDAIGQLIYDRHTIAIDLQSSADDVWKNEIHTKNRNIIKKGIKSGLTFEADYGFEHLDEFISLYNNTMAKLNADSFYFFEKDYYYRFKETFKNSFLGLVWYNDEIIASAIFFYQQPFGHYHLAGSNPRYLNLSPNNFLLWNAAMELQKHGVKCFHLGGGTDGNEDNSLFQFKKKFSKSMYDFYIGKVMFDEGLYKEIKQQWIADNPNKVEKYGNRLLCYRY